MISEPEVLKQDTRGRVRISAQRRERLLEEFDRSGASGAKFARLAGIKYSTFAAWMRKRHKKRSSQESALCPRPQGNGHPIRLLEAVIEGEVGKQTASHGLLVELPGGSRMVIESPVQMQMAAELVALIAERPRARC